MKILYPLIAFYPAQSGGPANTVYWMAKELVPYNFSPMVITTDMDIKDPTIIANKWRTLDNFKVLYTRNFSNKYALKLTFETIKKLRESDIIHLSGIFYPPYLIIAVFAILLRKKIIISTRGELEDFALTQGHSKSKTLIISIYKLLSKHVYFHGTSKSEIENIQRTFKRQKGCTEISNFMYLPKRIVTKKKNQFLFVGRINRIKAIHKVIEGFGLSKKFNQSDYIFYIAGSGDSDYEDDLKNQINSLGLSQKIKILGTVIEGLVKETFYAESKFLMLLSESENFGNVVIEAMAQATPSITSLGTPWEALNDQYIGYHIDNTPSSIAKLIDKVIDLDNKEYEIMSQKSYDYVKDNFDIKANIIKWVELYNQLV